MLETVFWGVACGGLYFLVMWWVRTQRLAQQREHMRRLYALSEKVVSAATPADIAASLAERLPALLEASAADLYLVNRATRTLHRVPTQAQAGPAAIPLEAPSEDLGNAIAACFRNRALLAIPDTRNSPLLSNPNGVLPRSVLLIPLISHEEGLGVISVTRGDRGGAFRPEHQTAAQHLANQVAAALKVQEQRALQEQLFRGEKLVASGQMIAGIAGELRAPLADMSRLCQELVALLKRRDDLPKVDEGMQRLAAEARRAEEIVTRLLALSREDTAAPRELDLGALLRNLSRFREPLWREQGLTVQQRLEGGSLRVLGVEGQLEQVFLTILMLVEQKASGSPTRSLSLRTGEAGGRARVEIGFATALGEDSDEHEQSGDVNLGVCRGVIENHSGEWKVQRRRGAFAYEITLPCVGSPAEAPRPVSRPTPVRPLTLMLVDAEPSASRPLLKMLTERGHRVVPAAGEEAADLAPRLRFDGVFWSARSGRGWGEFLERVRASIPAFVVVSDGYNQELATSLEQNGGFLLARPVEEDSLDRILSEIDERSRP